MSKYDKLWQWIAQNGKDKFDLTFEQAEQIAGLPIDHAFLTYKKELPGYGYEVARISLKNKTVTICKIRQ